jgi:type III secretion apparatus protein, HrpE/YscL family
MARLPRLTRDFTCPPGPGIVRADDYRALVDARKLIEAAQRDADALRQQAAEAFEAEKQRGYEAGLAQADAEAVEQRLRLAAETVDYLNTLEKDLARIVSEAVRRVLSHHDDDALVLDAVRRGLDALGAHRQVTLRVHPERKAGVQERLQTLARHRGTPSHVDVVADPGLSARDAVLESAAGVVDASVDVQLAAIEQALHRQMGHDER